MSRLKFTSKGPGKQKLVQTQFGFGCLVRVGARLVTFLGEQVCPLAIVERTTGRVFAHLQQSLSMTSDAAGAFRRCTRAAVTDSYSAIVAAERHIAAARKTPADPNVHIKCQVHRCSTAHGLAFAFVDPVLTGLIRTALALRNGSAMVRFRECLTAEIASRLKVCEGGPEPSAVAYKRSIISIFVNHGAKVLARRMILCLLPNGDWRSPTVEHYVHPAAPAEDRSPEFVAAQMCTGLLVVFTSRSPSLYQRARWTGAEMAIDDLAIMEACHRLLSTTFARFCYSFEKGGLTAERVISVQALRAYQGDVDLAEGDSELSALPDAGEGRLPLDDDDMAVGAAASGQGPEGAPEVGAASADKWAKVNTEDRAKGFAFCQSRPLPKLITMRIVLEPLSRYLREQFRLASTDFGRKEEAKLAAAVLRGRPLDKQKYPVTDYANGCIDRKFTKALRYAFECEQLWQVMPPMDQTVAARALAFKMLSRSGAAIEQLLASHHRKAPWKTFLLVDGDPDLIAEMRRLPDCMLDEWSKQFRKDYPTLCCEEAQAVLRLLLVLIRADISNVECKHASLRRLVIARSIQTDPVSLDKLSAMWVFMQAAKRAGRCSNRRRRGSPRKSVAKARGRRSRRQFRREKKRGRPRQRRGFGGAWRAWVRIHCKGERLGADMATIAGEYRAAKRMRTADYAEAAGLGASITSCAPLAEFRDTVSPVPRARNRRIGALEAALRMLQPGMDSAAGVFAFSEVSRYHGAMVSETLRASRAAESRVTHARADYEERRAETLTKFNELVGDADISKLRGLIPGAPPSALSAVPLPGGAMGVRVDGADTEDVVDALAWTSEWRHTTKLATNMNAHWAAMHENLAEGSCPEIAEAPPESLCLEAGICLCSRAGLALKQRGTRLVNFMKRVCPHKSGLRKQLIDGAFVFHIHGGDRKYDGRDATLRAVDLWYHASLHYMSPWRTTWHELQLAPDPGEMPPSDDRRYVRATMCFKTYFIGIQQLAPCDRIYLDVWSVEESRRRIGTMSPSVIPIHRVHGLGKPARFWPQRETGARAAGQAAGANDDADVAADGEHEVEEVEAIEEGEGVAAIEDESALIVEMEALLDTYVQPLQAGRDMGDRAASSSRTPADAAPSFAAPAEVRARPRPQPGQHLRAAGAKAPTIEVEGGKIVFYNSSGTFEAQCSCAAHRPRCTWSLKRSVAAGSSDCQTSPVGLLAHWLSWGDVGHCPTKASHKDVGLLAWIRDRDQLELAAAARQAVRDTPGGADFLELES